MSNIINNLVIIKQLKCIKAIKYVTNESNKMVYSNAQTLIEGHKRFILFDGNENPLTTLKKFYVKDLECKLAYVTKEQIMGKNEILDHIKLDIDMIERLSNDFIHKYNKYLSCIKYIENNSKYLSDEQEKIYLLDYNEIMNNNKFKNKIRVIDVK